MTTYSDRRIQQWYRYHLDHEGARYLAPPFGKWPLREPADEIAALFGLTFRARCRRRLERLARPVWREYLAARGKA